MAEEIYGIGVTLHPEQFPRVTGVEIYMQPLMPIISGVGITFERKKKPIIMTDRGALLLYTDSKTIATTEKGMALNLNQNNPNNLIYQTI